MKPKDLKAVKGITAYIMMLLVVCLASVYTGCSSKEDDATAYTVTFDAGGGAPVPPAQSVEAGGVAAAPADNPSKTGYVFLFWHLGGASTAYNFSTPVTGNITLQAKWQEEAKVEYRQVAWELGEGAWPATGDNHATQAVKGGMLAEPAAPVKTGGTFAGWYKEAALTNKVSFPYDVSAATGDVTLYAKWEDAAKAEYFGTWRIVPVDGKSWEQYTISADKIIWLHYDGGNNTLENLTWTEIMNQGGSHTANYTKGYRISGKVTKRNGYSFPKADGSGNAGVGDMVDLSIYIYTDKESIRIGNFTTPQHEAYYGPYNITKVEYRQVAWNLDGGAWPANDNHVTQAAKDGKIAAPTNPTKTDNNFAGWYTEAALTNLALFPYEPSAATGNVTFYAKWTDASPSVTLKVSVSPGAGFYASITAMRASVGSPSQYSIPTGIGTHTVKVSPGTYRIFYSYWACQTVNCLSSGYSGDFTVSTGQTKNISLVGSGVGL